MSDDKKEDKTYTGPVNYSVLTIAAMKYIATWFADKNIAKHEPLKVATSEEGVIEISGFNKGTKEQFMLRFDPKNEEKQYSYFVAKHNPAALKAVK